MMRNSGPLGEETLYRILSHTFPKQNDFGGDDYAVVLAELHHFGIETAGNLETLLAKHRENILEIDAEQLDEEHIRWYSDELGEDYVQQRIAGKFWFAYQGLLRIALELEFGEPYRKFAAKRDGLEDNDNPS